MNIKILEQIYCKVNLIEYYDRIHPRNKKAAWLVKKTKEIIFRCYIRFVASDMSRLEQAFQMHYSQITKELSENDGISIDDDEIEVFRDSCKVEIEAMLNQESSDYTQEEKLFLNDLKDDIYLPNFFCHTNFLSDAKVPLEVLATKMTRRDSSYQYDKGKSEADNKLGIIKNHIYLINLFFMESCYALFIDIVVPNNSIFGNSNPPTTSILISLKNNYDAKIKQLTYDNSHVYQVRDYFLSLLQEVCYKHGFLPLDSAPSEVTQQLTPFFEFLQTVGLSTEQEIKGLFYCGANEKNLMCSMPVDVNQFKRLQKNEIIYLFLKVHNFYLDNQQGRIYAVTNKTARNLKKHRWDTILENLFINLLDIIQSEENCNKEELYPVFSSAILAIRQCCNGDSSRLANTLSVLAEACKPNQLKMQESLYFSNISVYSIIFQEIKNSDTRDFFIETSVISSARDAVLKYLNLKRALINQDSIKKMAADSMNEKLFELERADSCKNRLQIYCETNNFEYNPDVLLAHPIRRACYYIANVFDMTYRMYGLSFDNVFFSQGKFGEMCEIIETKFKYVDPDDMVLESGSEESLSSCSI